MDSPLIWTIVGVLTCIVVLDLILRVVSIFIVLPIFERRPPFGIRPTTPDPNAEEIEFPTQNDLMLRGSLHRVPDKPSRGLVIFCPEFGGSQWSATWYCEALIAAGYTVLSFDFRNQGASDHQASYKVMHWLSRYDVEDVHAAIQFAKSREDLADLKIGLFGISRGGGAALTAAAQCEHVSSVATEGAFTTGSMMFYFALRWATLYVPHWLMRYLPDSHLHTTMTLVRWISQWRHGCRYQVIERWLPALNAKPILMMNGARDSYVRVEIPKKILSKAGNQAHHQLWRIPDAKHNQGRETVPEAYDEHLLTFFANLNSDTSTADPDTVLPTLSQS